MTLHDFCNLIKSNIDLFEQDYVAKHNKYKILNPSSTSYPLENTKENWFQDLEMWLSVIERLGDKRDQYLEVKSKTEFKDLNSELDLKDFSK